MTTMKKLLVVFGALVAVAAIVTVSVLGTIAYLSSSAAVSNVFTVGDVYITMTESKVNSDGTLADGGVTQVDTNTYHLVPGKKYIKDPKIFVQPGSEASYLFVLVRNDLEAIAIDNSGMSEQDKANNLTIAQQMIANGWYPYVEASTGTVYVYAGFTGEGSSKTSNVPANADIDGNNFITNNATAATTSTTATAGQTIKLFDYFVIDPDATVKTYGAAKITLTAVAIQADGFGPVGTQAAVNAAWDAVMSDYPYIHTGNNNSGSGSSGSGT